MEREMETEGGGRKEGKGGAEGSPLPNCVVYNLGVLGSQILGRARLTETCQ